MSNLDYCPFCGADEVALETTQTSPNNEWMAQVVCGHCCARGGNYICPELEEARQNAVENWNQKDVRRKRNQRS
jgi:hypothetical protein